MKYVALEIAPGNIFSRSNLQMQYTTKKSKVSRTSQVSFTLQHRAGLKLTRNLSTYLIQSIFISPEITMLWTKTKTLRWCLSQSTLIWNRCSSNFVTRFPHGAPCLRTWSVFDEMQWISSCNSAYQSDPFACRIRPVGKWGVDPGNEEAGCSSKCAQGSTLHRR